MKYKVLTFMKQHQIHLQGKTVLVGVSGGPDSMALLHYLHERQAEWDITLIAVAIDHQLRGEESLADITYVKDTCLKWGIPFEFVQVDVKAYEETEKVSTQVAARKLRYEAFEQKMNKYDGDFLALGHHGDDQVETLLMSLVRTTNLSSLLGIPTTRTFATGKIIRPLLTVTKQEIENYCKKYHIQPRLDNTNLDTSYTRNYFRKFIVPKVKERHPNVHITMQQLSESLQEDEQYLMGEAKKVFERVVQRPGNDQKNDQKRDKKVVLSVDLFKQCPLPLQRRVYQLILGYLYDELPKQLTYIHEQIFISLVKDSTNKVVHFPERLWIERSYHDVKFYFHEQVENKHDIQAEIGDIPERITLPDGSVLSITYISDLSTVQEDEHTHICSIHELSFPLTVRTRRPGDRMKVKGMNGSKKIKNILIDDKIPRMERDNIFLIEDKEEIFWLIGVRKGTKKLDQTNSNVMIKYEVADHKL